MPSTHTTNSVSVALFLYLLVAENKDYTAFTTLLVNILIAVYVGSVVLGRIYCGMHSFADCVVGGALGAGLVVLHRCWASRIEEFLVNRSPFVPFAILTTLILLMVVHPSTVDRCLCFDDAIACSSAMAGVSIGRWFSATLNFPLPPASSLLLFTSSTHHSIFQAVVYSTLKVVFGIGILLVWRIAAKKALRTPAEVVFGHPKAWVGHRPRPIDFVPSVVDIPALHPTKDNIRSREINGAIGASAPVMKDEIVSAAAVNANGDAKENEKIIRITQFRFPASEVTVKMIVYLGIGWLGSEIIPSVFALLGMD